LTSTIPSLPGSISYSYDANDRLSTDNYDNNGNTISSGGPTNIYDFENRMLTHGAVTMVYDGDGNRVGETAGGVTTSYLVDTLNPTGYSQVLDEVVGGAVTKTYAYGPAGQRESTRRKHMDAELLRIRRPRQRPVSGQHSLQRNKHLSVRSPYRQNVYRVE
jgi:hypothetical protein